MTTATANALAAACDHPQPHLDGNRTAQKYAGMAQDFRAKAWEHLEQGDLHRASNKAGGWLPRPSKPSARTMAASSTPTAPSPKWLENWRRWPEMPAIRKPGTGSEPCFWSPADSISTSMKTKRRRTLSVRASFCARNFRKGFTNCSTRIAIAPSRPRALRHSNSRKRRPALLPGSVSF